MFDIAALHSWFHTKKRNLPWRHHPDPYAVWVSEVMLQQTQVATVIPYFENWMKQFQTISALAHASQESVLKAWEGLGYYSRARALHEGAKYLVKHHEGILPNNKEQLELIKGLGPYTIGAILSFAFHKKIAAVDGNVMRVLARYFKIEGDISKSATQKQMRHLADSILPENESWITNEALIELGATICKRKPECQNCPLQNTCMGYKEKIVDKLPNNSKKIAITPLYRTVAVIRSGDCLLVQKGESGKIMSDLYQFPYFETTELGISSEELERLIKELGLLAHVVTQLPQVKQAFTRFRVRLSPVLLQCSTPIVVPQYEWKTYNQLKLLAFSSGHRRILEHLNVRASND